ncbi:MAG: anaerobic glycerol-3-phosphate dehydrogenase subunit C [Muribaculaceae bacterium]|nr:anaerobic glycerol-3-phosphate dehydrogenase subunit C [Muribaculaceae bacterium]
MKYQQHNVSPNNFEQCLKCTICTVYCPVVPVNPNYPGPKQAGPDGERYRLKKGDFYDEALKYCLNCKRCEVACPSNVRIGDIIQSARLKYSKQPTPLRDNILADTDLAGKLATKMPSIVNFMLKQPVVKTAMDVTLGVDRHRTFPKYAKKTFTKWFKHEALPYQSQYPRQVTYFHGCYVNYNNPQLGKDFVKIMNATGIGVQLMEKERCCGVAKIANRLTRQAMRDAQINLGAIREAVIEKGTQVVGTSSTCIFTMRDEYHHILHLDNNDVRSQINLATRYVWNLLEKGEIKLAFKPEYKKRIAYHTPCHMAKLGWNIYSIELMRMIPGVEVKVLKSECCGIAGTYGFKKENYKYSQAIGSALFEQIEEEHPDLVATDCETCKWQIEMSVKTPVEVLNPISVIADALDVEATKKLNNITE